MSDQSYLQPLNLIDSTSRHARFFNFFFFWRGEGGEGLVFRHDSSIAKKLRPAARRDEDDDDASWTRMNGVLRMGGILSWVKLQPEFQLIHFLWAVLLEFEDSKLALFFMMDLGWFWTYEEIAMSSTG